MEEDWEQELAEMEEEEEEEAILKQFYARRLQVQANEQGKRRGSIPGHVVINRGREEGNSRKNMLRSGGIIFETSSVDKTLTIEKDEEPHLDPPTPAKSDAMVSPAASPESPDAAPRRRRSLRLQSNSRPVVEAVTTRKRKSRVSQSPNVGEVRVLGESRPMDLRSGTRIAKREAKVEVDLDERLHIEAVVVEESRSEENVQVIDLEEEAKMINLRSGTRIAKVQAKGAKKENVVIDPQEWLDFEVSVDEEKLKTVDEPQLLETMTVKTVEAAGSERMSYEAKGKAKFVSDPDYIVGIEEEMDIDSDDEGNGKLVVVEDDRPLIDNYGVAYDDVHFIAQEIPEPRRVRNAKQRMTAESRKEAERNKALELAPTYAFFKVEEEAREEDEEEEDLAGNADMQEDWPGPFSTAFKIIRDREDMLAARELNSPCKKNDDTEAKIHWTPSKVPKGRPSGRVAPSLLDLCLKVLCENSDEIESLDGVPDVLKHRLVALLCQSRKMGSRALGLLVRGSPAEIHLTDCSWATEEEFEEAFGGCNTEKLKVVVLDISGRCFPDRVLQGILARSPNTSIPLLTKLSLKGNYRLSDDGLNAIVSSAPLLSSINLSECSLITSAGIIGLADKLELVLRELYIDDCQDVDAMLILPALMKLKHLEVLSVAGIESISNKFVKKLVSVCGSTIKELVFSGCRKLSAASMKVIGESCSQLCSLDLQNLNRLNDSAIGHLANGCRSIQKLKLRRNAFSDEAVAAFVEASGGSLIDLSVNNVEKVAQQTAIAISRQCSSSLRSLDLSFCRNMTDEALGLIVDNCSSLQTLKLFGCTQVTDAFLKGHSNPNVKIIGLTGPVFDQIQVLGFL